MQGPDVSACFLWEVSTLGTFEPYIAHLKLRRELPKSSEGGDLHSEDHLETLIVVESSPFSVIHCKISVRIMPHATEREGHRRLGSALLCRSFFFLPDLSVLFLMWWGPSSVTSVVSFL